MLSKPLLIERSLICRAVDKLHANNIYGRELYDWLVDVAHVDLDILKEVLHSKREKWDQQKAA